MLQKYDSELNLCCIPVDIEWNKRNQRKKTNDLMNPEDLTTSPGVFVATRAII